MLDVVKTEIEATIARLKCATFPKDPLFSERRSRSMSVSSSATKRHGKIIEFALRAGLTASGEYDVWDEPAFLISPGAAILVSTLQLDGNCRETNLAYGERVGSSRLRDGRFKIDIMAFHRRRNFLNTSEVKRANGNHDSNGKTQMLRDLKIKQVLLRSYGERRGLTVKEHVSNFVTFYGCRDGIPFPWTITGQELDDHFQVPIYANILSATGYFRRLVNDFINELEGLGPALQVVAAASR